MTSEGTDFGSTLRATREGRGWSLEDVSHRTRIPLATLRQLEDNDYSKFAGHAYTKSFLAQYSEHLGIDAAELLDSFETGDALANLDSYEYLKDHDEHVDASPLVMSRAKAKKESTLRQEKAPRTARTALQPLMVFSVTALLITGAVFGFMKLSDSLSEITETAAVEEAEETLTPVAGIPGRLEPRRDSRFDGAPRAVIVPPEDNLLASTPRSANRSETFNANPSSHKDAPVEVPLDSPPPRAVIVEE